MKIHERDNIFGITLTVSLKAKSTCPHHNVESVVEGKLQIKFYKKYLGFVNYNRIFQMIFNHTVLLEEALAAFKEELVEKLDPISLDILIESHQQCSLIEEPENDPFVSLRISYK